MGAQTARLPHFNATDASLMFANTITERSSSGNHMNQQGLCAKSLDPSTMTDLIEETTTTMCMLERVFPPSFFDVMSHLPIHLAQQMIVCGPVHTQ